MKQISTWVFGSFFRTIGRLLVFVLLGFIIASVVDFGDIFDNFRITDLFFEKVNASSYGTFWPTNVKFTDTGVQNYSSVNMVGDFYSIPRTVNGWANNGFFKFDQVQLNSNAKDIYVNFRVTKITADTINMDYSTMSCDIHHDLDQFNSGIYGPNFSNTSYDYNLYDFTGVDCEFEDLSGDIRSSNYVISLKYWYNNNEDVAGSCYLVSQASGALTFRCPIISNNINGFRYSFYSRDNSNYYLGFSPFISYELSEAQAIINAQNQNTNAINNQTQQQQQQHDELMDTNMTETNETATSFFDSFESNDIGGLSGIVTAPLNMINKMLDGTCTSPSATWKGATISLPCGDMFWNRPGAGDIKNLLNIFYGGFLCYYAIRKLFLMVENLKDPTQDRIEVSDL